MSDKKLIVSDVTVNTATIEVKVMKIGNRQVTLAVFRQLPSEAIHHPETGELCGIPWGRVNYHVSCEGLGTHLHIVWQKGSELRRAIVAREPRHPRYLQLLQDFNHWLHRYAVGRIVEGKEEDESPPDSIFFLIDGVEVEYSVPNYLKKYWWKDSPAHNEIKFYLESEWEKDNRYKDSDDIENKVLAGLLREKEELLNILNQSYAQLEQLDQLFIAV